MRGFKTIPCELSVVKADKLDFIGDSKEESKTSALPPGSGQITALTNIRLGKLSAFEFFFPKTVSVSLFFSFNKLP